MFITNPPRTLGGLVQPEASDNPVHIPPTLSPITFFPASLTAFYSTAQGAAGDIKNSSFILRLEQQIVQNTATANTNLAQLSAGIWLLRLGLACWTDFTSPGPIQAGYPTIGFENLELTKQCELIRLGMVANVPQFQSIEVWVKNDRDGMLIYGGAPGTGAGQNCCQLTSILANRIA